MTQFKISAIESIFLILEASWCTVGGAGRVHGLVESEFLHNNRHYNVRMLCLVSITISNNVIGHIKFKTVKLSTGCECSYFSRSFIILIEEPL